MYALLKRVSHLVVLLLLLGLATGRAFAVDRAWNNAAGGDFNTAANWTPSGVPGPADKAVITLAGTYTVTMSGAASVAGLILGDSSGTQTLDTSGKSLTLGTAASTIAAGGVMLDNGSTLDLNGALTVNGTLTESGASVLTTVPTGSLIVKGTFNLNGGTLTGAGAQTAAAGGVLNWTSGTLSGAGATQITTIASGGTLNYSAFQGSLIARTLTNYGTVNWTNYGNLRAGSGAVINNESGALVDITVSDENGFTNSLRWNNTGNPPAFNNKAGATLRRRTGSNLYYFGDVKFTNGGTVDVQNGQFYLSYGNNGVVNGTSTGTFNATAPGILTFANQPLTLSGASLTGTGTTQILGTVTLKNLSE